MPELERDVLADAFFDFRIKVPHEITVPGTGAVKRTVRRRRTATMGALVAVIFAVVFGAGLVLEGRDRVPGVQETAPPALTSEQLDLMGVQALAKLGYTPDDSRPGLLFGGMRAANSSYTFGTADEPFPAGGYSVSAVCVGAGGIDVSWEDRGQVKRLEVRCGDDPKGGGELRLVSPGTIRVWLDVDAAAVGRAGAAVMVTDPRTVTAVNALGTPVHQVSGGSGSFNRSGAGRMDVDQSGSKPGHYTLVVVCAGAGTVKATITIGDATATNSVPCRNVPLSPVSITLPSTRMGLPLAVSLEPDESASGSAGYAYAVTFRAAP